MEDILFLKPAFVEKIWGGEKLRELYGYAIPSNKTGECWAISGHPNLDSEFLNEELKSIKLSELFKSKPNLFGNPRVEKFPLLTKIIDASEDLSVQVHPNDEYGFKYENEQGKTECWYILEAEENSKIVYGHNAKSKEELKRLIESGKWDKLLKYVDVKAGDFFYVPSGTIHAIGKGIVVLETQQSSDTTYRVYDYDRLDSIGQKRELHIEKSIDVITVPHFVPSFKVVEETNSHSKIKTLLLNEYFNVFSWEIFGKTHFNQYSTYSLVSVVSGDGKIKIMNKKYSISAGDHFIIPANISSWIISGELHCICSSPSSKNL